MISDNLLQIFLCSKVIEEVNESFTQTDDFMASFYIYLKKIIISTRIVSLTE